MRVTGAVILERYVVDEFLNVFSDGFEVGVKMSVTDISNLDK